MEATNGIGWEVSQVRWWVLMGNPAWGGSPVHSSYSHRIATSSVSPLSWQRHQSKQMLAHPPPNLLLSPVAWMTWISWARLCCNSLCLQSPNKCDGK